ncbi:MAG: nitroreductase family protein [Melioribacteraceae bacterium]|nr:nitroreductase family protein [Melioribacteraceae bacterium]
MEFLELVKKRRSVRSYLSKEIPEEYLEKILEAGRLAPSACNSQPWSFIIIKEKEIINRLVDRSMTGKYNMNKFAKEAPVIIVAVTEKSKYVARLAGLLRDVKYNLIDIGIVCDHITLQAAELGLGTCWLGWFDESEVKKVLNLSSRTKIDVILTLGFPADNSVREKRRKKIEDIVTTIE